MRRYATLLRVWRWHRGCSKTNPRLCWLPSNRISSSSSSGMGIPRGFLPVYVGSGLRRVVIPTAYLSKPEFREVMERAEEEFGFQQNGGLQLPCTDQEFDDLMFICNRNYS